MPTYNPYAMSYNTYGSYYMPQTSYMGSYQQNSTPQYMITVDGEMAARAWQMPNNLPPNTVIPLWDLDGKHVYFRSVDVYGRLNPLRKGQIVFDEEPQNLSQGNSGAQQGSGESSKLGSYMTKDEFRNEIDQFKNEIRSMMQTNQNGTNSINHQQNRGNK